MQEETIDDVGMKFRVLVGEFVAIAKEEEDDRLLKLEKKEGEKKRFEDEHGSAGYNKVATAESFLERHSETIAKIGQQPYEADSYINTASASKEEKEVVKFLLNVFDCQRNWNAGKLDLNEALKIWDDERREVFANWAKDPFWVYE